MEHEARPGHERYALLPRLSVRRPVTILMLVCALITLGAVSLTRLPIQMMPSGYDPPFMSVWVPYPGANPSEVEEKLLRPLEDAFYTVRGAQEVNCRASADMGRCWVQFAQSVDMEETYNQVADRVERLRATVWPDDVERVRIRRFSPTSDPNLIIGIRIPPGLEDPYWTLQNEVVNRMERVEGVAQVDLEGVREKQIFIEPDRQALEAHRVSVRDLVQVLRRANFALSSGDVRDGEQKLLVRSVARFRSVEEIGNLTLRADGLRLRDVGRVRYDHPELTRVTRLDGQPAAIVEIVKESEANTIAVTRAAREELDRIFEESRALSAAGRYSVLFDQGDVIRESIGQLRDTGLLGALLALSLLYFFLRRIRVTLLITLAIPTSLLTALVVVYFAGESLNLITLMGLIICTGMLVDSAVVVVENIDRYRREGHPVHQAALIGASEIAQALTLATVTTIAVFLPMVLMSSDGMMRFFLTKMSIPVVVSIVASLIVALLFLPLAASLLLRSEADRAVRRKGPITRVMDAVYARTLEPLHRVYEKALELALAHRPVTLLLVLATLAATIAWPMQQVEFAVGGGRGQQGGRTAGFFFHLPNSYGIEQSDAWFRRVEQIFMAEADRFGIRHVQTRFWRNRGQVRAILKDARESNVSVEQAVAGLRPLIPDEPGVRTFVSWQRGSGTDPSLTVTLYGEDTPTLAELAAEAERRLRTIPELVSVEPDLENALDEVRIRVSREQALRYGVGPEVVSGTVTSALRGVRLPRYRQAEKEVEMTVQFPEEDRQGLGRLASLDLPSAGGRRIPLDALAEVAVTRGYGEIQRTNRRTAFSIKLNTTVESLQGLRGKVTQVMNTLELPRGYSWDFGSFRRWERQDNTNFLLGLALSIVLIYFIMGFLFESAVLPLSVMPSIALSWIGVFWLLWATGSRLDMLAGIGLVLLAGVVVNNGIVLVDLINRLRRSGLSRDEAIRRAGSLRFRPILMTSLTTIMGMLPMAFGSTNFVGIPFTGLGRTFVGGLLASTSLTLIVVPLFYTLLDDARGTFGYLFSGRGLGDRSPGPAEPTHAGALMTPADRS